MSDVEIISDRLRRYDEATKASAGGFTLFHDAAREIEALRFALERARPYVEEAVKADGGIDGCAPRLRADLEAIDEVLSPPEEQPHE